MLRDYEFTMVVRPDLSEEDIGTVLATYEQKIAARDGTVLRKDAVGTKRFSYPIKKCFRGYFVNYDISADPKVVKDMEHQIRFDDKVLRHLIIGMDRRKSAAVREEIATEQKRLAAAQAESAARSSESDVINTPPPTLDKNLPPLSEETVIDNTPPIGEAAESDDALPKDNGESAEIEDTDTSNSEAISPNSEETVIDKSPPLTEETVVDGVPSDNEKDKRAEQQS